jgi:hypothetical protein
MCRRLLRRLIRARRGGAAELCASRRSAGRWHGAGRLRARPPPPSHPPSGVPGTAPRQPRSTRRAPRQASGRSTLPATRRRGRCGCSTLQRRRRAGSPSWAISCSCPARRAAAARCGAGRAAGAARAAARLEWQRGARSGSGGSLTRSQAPLRCCAAHFSTPAPVAGRARPFTQEPIPGADAAVTTGSAALPPTQSGCLAWLLAAGVAVSGDNGVSHSFEAAVGAAEEWMDSRGRLGARSGRGATGPGPSCGGELARRVHGCLHCWLGRACRTLPCPFAALSDPHAIPQHAPAPAPAPAPPMHAGISPQAMTQTAAS